MRIKWKYDEGSKVNEKILKNESEKILKELWLMVELISPEKKLWQINTDISDGWGSPNVIS